jgi:chromate reductase, NAD(P)H dehydrogenase (quinone)
MNDGRGEPAEGGIRIVVINGSVRPSNYTNMASAIVVDELRRHPRISVEVVDPRTLRLLAPGAEGDGADAEHLRQAVSRATGVILCTPEYHGSFSSVMKLIIENLGFPSVLSGKPVALLGVAAGSIGAVKSLEHLRSVVSHIGGLVLPLPISVDRHLCPRVTLERILREGLATLPEDIVTV